jgi:hypothetical protein
MSFLTRTYKFLGIAPSEELENLSRTNEQLNELVLTQERLLQEANAFENNFQNLTNPNTVPSSLAREQHHKPDQKGLVLRRVPVKELQLLYINNQFIFRGVNFRADELVTRGYSIACKDENIREEATSLIERSGGINLLWQLSVNADVCGDAYLEKIPNKTEDKILLLRHVNPINFGFLTRKDDPHHIEVDEKGFPKAYMQIVYDSEGKEQRKIVSREKIAHLKFNTFGDEFNGISILQPVYSTAIRLMNMEQAAAEAAVKTANPVWVVHTKTKSPRDLNMWANTLGRISGKEVVFLPEGVEVELKSPGNQNFSPYSSYFLVAVVSALGVPKSILTGSSEAGGGNRATLGKLSQHFYSIMRANQRYVEMLFYNDIFRDYAQRAGWKEIPRLVFSDVAEDADRNGVKAVELYDYGIITVEEARSLIGLDTTEDIISDLKKNHHEEGKTKVPRVSENKDDMETWHEVKPGRRAGSQKGNKLRQKFDPDVKSVR